MTFLICRSKSRAALKDAKEMLPVISSFFVRFKRNSVQDVSRNFTEVCVFCEKRRPKHCSLLRGSN
jgi:hypothetical protein